MPSGTRFTADFQITSRTRSPTLVNWTHWRTSGHSHKASIIGIGSANPSSVANPNQSHPPANLAQTNPHQKTMHQSLALLEPSPPPPHSPHPNPNLTSLTFWMEANLWKPNDNNTSRRNSACTAELPDIL